MATVLVLAVLMLFMTGHSDGASWCACRTDVSESALQKALDYACGNGADCKPILQNGACFQPNTVRAHCSYAVNSYYQNKGQAQGSCIFSNSATVVQNDPSTGGTCTYPSSASFGGNGGTTPSVPTPPGFSGGGGGFNSPPGFSSPPGVFSPPGLGPSPFDNSNGVTKTEMVSVFLTLGFSILLSLLMIV
ncbi:hypothetical protein C5167_022710 [Papaver somniferum]|uniref:X8 domain-containing protein n=1 Tax=Papaver somniferum TaxID=3469 RepID=A0A4Y7JLT2_PAPSO|nr:PLASMODESMATA CALLOSE-BINDING PROTEIN 2-like [Papaver somniferum]RZC60972.1 hypothetical protein C5167_022710 [Papaver somniferum]